jgi:hypothetical protein
MRNAHGVNPLRIGTVRAEEKCACSIKTGTAGKSRALLATAPPRENEEKQMRVDSQIYRLDMSRSQYDDLRMLGSSRGSARLTARFQEALQLDAAGELPATDLSANHTIQERSDALLTLSESAGKTEPPVSRWTRSVAPAAGGEGSATTRAAWDLSETNRLAARLDGISSKALAVAGATTSRESAEAAQIKRNSAEATVPVTRVNADSTATVRVPDAVVKELIHTPFGTYDPNSRFNRLVTDVIGGSPMEVYFMTHAPGEWMRDAGARAEFVKIYGATALVTVDHHGTVPRNMDPVWVTKSENTDTSGRA